MIFLVPTFPLLPVSLSRDVRYRTTTWKCTLSLFVALPRVSVRSSSSSTDFTKLKATPRSSSSLSLRLPSHFTSRLHPTLRLVLYRARSLQAHGIWCCFNDMNIDIKKRLMKAGEHSRERRARKFGEIPHSRLLIFRWDSLNSQYCASHFTQSSRFLLFYFLFSISCYIAISHSYFSLLYLFAGPPSVPDVPPRNPTMSRMNGRVPQGIVNDLDMDFEPSCLVRTPSGNVYIPSGNLSEFRKAARTTHKEKICFLFSVSMWDDEMSWMMLYNITMYSR